MEKIVSLCKRRRFISQPGEISGNLNACCEYGPLGVELKRNVKEFWWRSMERHQNSLTFRFSSTPSGPYSQHALRLPEISPGWEMNLRRLQSETIFSMVTANKTSCS